MRALFTCCFLATTATCFGAPTTQQNYNLTFDRGTSPTQTQTLPSPTPQTRVPQNPNSAATATPSNQNVDITSNLEPDLKAAHAAGENWLRLIDSNNYTGSWEQAALQLRALVNKDGWDTAMKKTRNPLGSLQRRQLKDLRTAKNPPGVAAGDYVVLVYDTDFSNRAKANEMVILVKESDGQWRVMSYYAR